MILMLNIVPTTGSNHTPFFCQLGEAIGHLENTPPLGVTVSVKQHQIPAAECTPSQLKSCCTSLLPCYWTLIYEFFSPNARYSRYSRRKENTRSFTESSGWHVCSGNCHTEP
ncbi:hypothetical protein M431DRAFT_253138 [Trichoderma harzianum CBS 226.95]|uniref:Uncharacterized protein n=1 Tax=Trichoderma harzianum CBS 226.95 TaxID=983964 RepID=A0A2T4A043_TRIHA|nr:hypothetical protein M431DRAFT_253138 [Trichoderma harzianum CBS 226.95]PTB50432.1 hypothetical protein M431DRAFT_253138 [Trichoderma harzianum CBS 226.95]